MSSKGDRTKAHILRAAASLFCERDYHGASIADIADLAQVKKASVFYHFGTKEDLFRGVVDDYYDRQRELFEAAIGAEGQTLRQKVHNLVDAYADFLEKEWEFVSLVQRLSGARHPMSRHVTDQANPIVDWLRAKFENALPAKGETSFFHFYATITGAASYYYTNHAALQPNAEQNLLSQAALDERRKHLHWLVGTLLDRYEIE